MFIEILFKILLFKGGVLIYAEHCIQYIYIYIYIYKSYGGCFYCLWILTGSVPIHFHERKLLKHDKPQSTEESQSYRFETAISVIQPNVGVF